MKYFFTITFSILLIISQNVFADSSDFFGGMAGGFVGSMVGQAIQKKNSEQQNTNQQNYRNTSQTSNQKRSTRKRSKSRKKRVSQDLSPIAIAFRKLPMEKKLLLQTKLQTMEYYQARVDGMWGGGTRNAIIKYAKNIGQEYLLATPDGSNILFTNIINTQIVREENLLDSPNEKIIHEKSEGANFTNNSSMSTGSSQQGLKELKLQYNEIQKQIALLNQILEDQKSRPENSSKQPKIRSILDQIEIYNGNQKNIADIAQRKYKTPIHPQNKNLGITAVKASEAFPKIPYYISGTKEIGDMWVEPKVSDEGKLYYSFIFMDPVSDYAKVRESIRLESKDIEMMVKGFEKVSDWTNTAQKKGIRKRFSKRAICFPATNCSVKKVGNTSTEVIFMIYEDGSTAAKVQRNKGNFSSSYNFSVESAMLLAAYLEFVKGEGQKEFETGTMTEEKLNKIFE